MKRYWPGLGLLVLLVAGCDKDDDQPNVTAPAAQTITLPPAEPQPPTSSTGTTPSNPADPGAQPPAGSLPLQIFTDDLHQGGAFLYPGGENQMLSFNDTSTPAVGARSI